MYTLINGSHKYINSNSSYFLNKLKLGLNEYNVFELRKSEYIDIVNNIKKSDVVVFAFPLYVDSPSSITLSFLDYLIDEKIELNNKLVYVIVNCGFRESKHNENAINVMRRWCAKIKGIYAGGILIGAGEIVGKESYKFISHNVINKFKYFSFMVKHKRKITDINVTVDLFNNKLYCLIANLFWDKKARKNKLSKKDLRIE